MQEQHCDQRELPAAAETYDSTVVDDFQRSEYPELHSAPPAATVTPRQVADWRAIGATLEPDAGKENAGRSFPAAAVGSARGRGVCSPRELTGPSRTATD
jgi:hypothetical protein